MAKKSLQSSFNSAAQGGGGFDKDGFFKAVAANDTRSVARILLAHPQALDLADSANDGKTPLIVAIENNAAQTATALLLKGADINKGNARGTTPLIYAAHHGQGQMIHHLIQQGADVHHQNDAGTSPLMAAAWSGDALSCALLLQAGADPDVQDSEGMSPLMFAAQKGNSTAAGLLFHENADIDLVNDYDQTALDVAEESGIADLDVFEAPEMHEIDPAAIVAQAKLTGLAQQAAPEAPAKAIVKGEKKKKESKAKAEKKKEKEPEKPISQMVEEVRANAQDVVNKINTPTQDPPNKSSDQLMTLNERLKKAKLF